MEIYADSGFALARLAELKAARAEAEAHLRERDSAGSDGSIAAASEVKAQRKVAAESANFVAAQKVVWNGTILQAEGAAAGTTVDIRV